VRQQSMAVLPPPSTSTRLPILSVCSKATLASQSIPMWTCLPASSSSADLALSLRGCAQPHDNSSDII
jgi:hypothetical protein